MNSDLLYLLGGRLNMVHGYRTVLSAHRVKCQRGDLTYFIEELTDGQIRVLNSDGSEKCRGDVNSVFVAMNPN